MNHCVRDLYDAAGLLSPTWAEQHDVILDDGKPGFF